MACSKPISLSISELEIEQTAILSNQLMKTIKDVHECRPMTKYILSIDGGGIRGIIPAVILAEIEQTTNKPISQIFDLMAGTSSGGIIVAGLAKKSCRGKPQYSAKDLVDLYLEYGPQIFDSSCSRKSFASIKGGHYSSENIEHVFHNYFGDDTLKNTLTNVLTTSYDIYNNCPFIFKSWKDDRNLTKLRDVLRATTASPTYFLPKRLRVNHTDRVLVDGGVFANNPAACAYASGKTLFPNDEIILLSIGTGRPTRRITYDNARKYNKIGWITPLLDLMFDSSLDAVNYQMEKVMGDKYIRIQSQLNVASAEIDNVTAKNIKCLQQEANEMMVENQALLAKFCDKFKLAEKKFCQKAKTTQKNIDSPKKNRKQLFKSKTKTPA